MHSVAVVFMILMVIAFPALCVSRIATKMGRSGLVFGLLTLMPLGILFTLGFLALDPRKLSTTTSSS